MKNYVLLGLACVAIVFSLNGCISSIENKKISKTAYDETALKNFIVSAHEISESKALNALDSMLNKATTDSTVFCQTISFLGEPFSDPNSPFRNEKLYIEILEQKINSKWYSSEEKDVFRKHLHLAMQNDVGEPANDFTYITPHDEKKTLYDVKANYTLLFFYNPECPACKDMKASLIASNLLTKEIAPGKLKLLAVYTDEDEKMWRKHLPEMPNDWIEGRDENEYLFNNSVYDLKAIPTLYLLDKNKKVLLKDCLNISKIENAVSR